jgi:hypothetical protein
MLDRIGRSVIELGSISRPPSIGVSSMVSLSNSALRRLLEHVLDRINPDILHPHIDPGSMKFGPQPNPWRGQAALPHAHAAPQIMLGAFFARSVIDRANSLLRASAVLAGGESEKRATGVIVSQVMEDIENICGNGMRHWPFPWPWPGPWKLDPVEISPIDLLVAGSEFQAYVDTFKGAPLTDAFAKAAETLMATAAKRLESPAVR